MKFLIICAMLAMPIAASASVDCDFTPTVVKVGAYGAHDGYLFVCGDDNSNYNCYNLGAGTDAQAKNRYSTVLAAIMADKAIKLRFYSETSCADARSNLTVPNSTWVLG